MIMEAMRLSLLEHEQQEQRRREEEERNRRNGETSERGRSMETGNNASLDTPSGQRSASVVPPEPAGERIDHRPSTSLPNNNPLDGLNASGNWRRNPSQFSTLAAAINAANTVSAILSADGRGGPSLSTRTTGTDGDTTTISSDSSGRSSARLTPAIDAVDQDEAGEVDYATLPSSPELPDSSPSFLARRGDGGTAVRPRSPE